MNDYGYEIMMVTKDNDGNPIHNDFYVSGEEAAYDTFDGLVDLFPDAMVDLVDLETGEILKSTEFDTEEEEEEEDDDVDVDIYCLMLDLYAWLDTMLF